MSEIDSYQADRESILYIIRYSTISDVNWLEKSVMVAVHVNDHNRATAIIGMIVLVYLHPARTRLEMID